MKQLIYKVKQLKYNDTKPVINRDFKDSYGKHICIHHLLSEGGARINILNTLSWQVFKVRKK